MRFMACAEDWEHNPTKAKPGNEAEVKGPYLSSGLLTTKDEFEASGPRTDLG